MVFFDPVHPCARNLAVQQTGTPNLYIFPDISIG
jgi:hypothetical protein